MRIKIIHFSPSDRIIDCISKRESQIRFASHNEVLQAQKWLNDYDLIEMLMHDNVYRKSNKIYYFIMSLFSISKIYFSEFEIKIEYNEIKEYPSIIINGSKTDGIRYFERAVYYMSPCVGVIECNNPPKNYYNHLIYWKNNNKYHGDYFRYNCKYSCDSKDIYVNNCRLNLSFLRFEFRTSFINEQFFRRTVATSTETLIVNCKTDYEKVKSIYQYVVNHVNYDYTFTYYSAYDALIRGSAVCEGISLLLYTMLRQANVITRMASGIGRTGPHGWNIVYLNDNWYNLDATWDLGRNNLNWIYFLRGSMNFPNHTLSTELSEEFKREKIFVSLRDYKL